MALQTVTSGPMAIRRLQVVMVNFKSCPRCKGDMTTGSDMYGSYLQCFQCGHSVNLESPRARFTATQGRQKPGRPKKTSKAKQPAA
jgi:DNA-directed RNA polymerase subunit M/transcription elongation factor TFIIS